MCQRGNEARSQLALFEVLACLQVINLLSHTKTQTSLEQKQDAVLFHISYRQIGEFLLLLPNVRHNILKVISTIQVGPSREIRQKHEIKEKLPQNNC